MADTSLASQNSSTSINDLEMDTLVHCASYLNLQDLSNMAMSSKYLQRAAYSDSIWKSLFRQQWSPLVLSGFSETSTAREAYLARRTNLLQFKFIDPCILQFPTVPQPHENMYLDKDNIIFSQDSTAFVLKTNNFLCHYATLRGHTARITSMRLIPFEETCLYHSEMRKDDNLLVTSSLDHSIRLWWKGHCQRCFKGHVGGVSTLSDKLLGDHPSKTLASGGLDGTVRLWSLDSCGNRGQQPLKATLYGHEKPVVLMSVARHKTSLLVSISTNSKVRFPIYPSLGGRVTWYPLLVRVGSYPVELIEVMVWDTATSSAARSSCCVGRSTVPGAPKAMKCHESLAYIAAGSSVVAVDIRTMRQVYQLKHSEEVHSFQLLPEKSLICTGLAKRATLWDVRIGCNIQKEEFVAELDGHRGNVNLLHMDPYKIVSGAREDIKLRVWETGNGRLTNALSCCPLCDYPPRCSSMAVDGCRIVTACDKRDHSCLHFWDFNNAMIPTYSEINIPESKFWGPQSQSDSEEEPDNDSS